MISARQMVLLERLVDALVPGDDSFPSASTVGVHGKLLERSYTAIGPGYVEALLARFDSTSSDDALADALTAYERQAPDEFELLLAIVYMSYYETLPVKDAIRALGHDYHDTPQPGGYAMSAFDPANSLENPTHHRGHYVPTDRVERVAWEPLGDLGKRVG